MKILKPFRSHGTTGVFPVHNNIFKIGTKGRASINTEMLPIKDLETFSPSIDANTEEWTPMDTAGWIRRAVTGKGLSFSFSGKRNYGDPGSDYIASTILGTGQCVESIFEWTLPNGDVFSMNCIISLTTPAGGDSTAIDGLEFEVLSDGLPTYTSAGNVLSFVTLDGATADKTKVTTVTPTLTGGNSYKFALNVATPALGTTATTGWTAYTLGADATAVENDKFVLVEVNASNVVVRAGYSHANVQ